jgi:hypothetical protein
VHASPDGQSAARRVQRVVRWPDAAISLQVPTRARMPDPAPLRRAAVGPPTPSNDLSLPQAGSVLTAPRRAAVRPLCFDRLHHLPLTARLVAVTAVLDTFPTMPRPQAHQRQRPARCGDHHQPGEQPPARDGAKRCGSLRSRREKEFFPVPCPPNVERSPAAAHDAPAAVWCNAC